MRSETPESPKPLRSGYTTGACATATSLAAARLLLTGDAATVASIELPRGQFVEFAITDCTRLERPSDSGPVARASTVKDAGDDPDATHGATVFAEVELVHAAGVQFKAARGVGTFTREGLSLPVGEPAINPVPRQMMTRHLQALAESTGYTGGFRVAIGVEDGERIALNTMNGKLGIVGGLSILGTTGIVRPFSCAAYIASIHQAIDVAHANGLTHIAACTGSTSEQYVQSTLALPPMGIIEMGDFAGAVLKHLRKVPMQRLSICGGFGKLTKLAAGHTTLHSQHVSIDFVFLARLAEELGASQTLCRAVSQCTTTGQALALCTEQGVDLGSRVCALARQTASEACRHRVAIDVHAVDRRGQGIAVSASPTSEREWESAPGSGPAPA